MRRMVVDKAENFGLGERRVLDVDGWTLAVFNVGGKYHGLNTHCTHAGVPMADGPLEGNVLTCPWHGAEFDVTTGHALSAPAGGPVDCYPVAVEDGEVVMYVPERI